MFENALPPLKDSSKNFSTDGVENEDEAALIILNHKLEQFYTTKLESWKQLHAEQAKDGRRLSIPLFLKASSAYLSANIKILFVGQETHGWWTTYSGDINDLTAGKIMDFYEDESLILYEKYKRSSYWRAMRYIVKALLLTDLPRSFLYSNIFPCDLDKKRPPLALHDNFRRWNVLPNELRVLEPDYVIFFCGREYYGNLECYFSKGPGQFVSTATPLVQYQPPDHAWTGFVTYHPAYLQRSSKRMQWNILDDIIDFIKADVAANSQSSTT